MRSHVRVNVSIILYYRISGSLTNSLLKYFDEIKLTRAPTLIPIIYGIYGSERMCFRVESAINN